MTQSKICNVPPGNKILSCTDKQLFIVILLLDNQGCGQNIFVFLEIFSSNSSFLFIYTIVVNTLKYM